MVDRKPFCVPSFWYRENAGRMSADLTDSKEQCRIDNPLEIACNFQ
ncbi:hypothetical protein GTE33_004753 [Salmonella enterica]|uniref:Uncharacterized protein n=2 Tax=Salmonella enterica TaxID=28901 RepID=A0A740W800_SALTM|nr:hypothetical protein [Salmonella enterica]EEI3452769.1 hypothetical protein [Salmonella enterica subsp. enterica serovar Infantis]HAF0436314.1 hypothetical protein [Salmonella enterica subsp. enterica serovar Typhimurium]EDZ7599192.1 hypothetical protein [Salmonella enterica]EEG6280366.1 hypothetical protein [Salmonella enterica]